nr:arsenic resistance N-acetyltransferase ArsN2 [Rhabdobacter roseus]
MEIGTVQPSDRSAVLELLKASDLPVLDVEASLSSFLVAKAAGAVVGVAALERYGPQALLRSVAVREDYRGHGLAKRLVSDLLRQARLSGIQDVYLLTTTAEGYFANKGFVRLPRESTPEAIRATAQFAELCPSTAVVMHQRLEKPRLNLADLQSSCCTPNSGCC